MPRCVPYLSHLGVAWHHNATASDLEICHPEPSLVPSRLARRQKWCHSGAMKLNPYVAGVRSELLTVAEAGGEAATELAERLTAPLESAIRLTLLQALSAAAEEITAELAPGSVEVRLRGADPEFVVSVPASAAPGPVEPSGEEPSAASVSQVQLPSAPEDDDGQMVRI